MKLKEDNQNINLTYGESDIDKNIYDIFKFKSKFLKLSKKLFLKIINFIFINFDISELHFYIILKRILFQISKYGKQVISSKEQLTKQ